MKALVLRQGVSSPLDKTLLIQDNHEQNEDSVQEKHKKQTKKDVKTLPAGEITFSTGAGGATFCTAAGGATFSTKAGGGTFAMEAGGATISSKTRRVALGTEAGGAGEGEGFGAGGDGFFSPGGDTLKAQDSKVTNRTTKSSVKDVRAGLSEREQTVETMKRMKM